MPLSPSDISTLEEIAFWCFIFGVPGGIAGWWKKWGATRHARKVELARIKYGRGPGPAEDGPLHHRDDDGDDWEEGPIPPIGSRPGRSRTSISYAVSRGQPPDVPDTALPAAVIPAPPGARPVRGVPGPCQHERIVPVITSDGELRRWACANYPRCMAWFPPDTAIYDGDYHGPE
jgi:hypothetical protein